MISSSMLIKLLLILSISSVAFSVDDKCAACNAVAEELERGLSNEKPRNHLDMRHRLDSTGQRRGKLIDYRVSELRVVELLEGLCEKMQDYTLQKLEPTRQEWIKVDNWDNLTNKQEARAYSKDISTYCGRLLEETEDEFAELIKNGSVKVGDVSKVLCQDLSKHCSKTGGSYEDDGDDDDESDGEL
ncbi:protein seele [Morus notabilis]|uniref:protein seele n=1 Tax=Morus notabilis TaxID=981085 RepID=UPI000CED2871|nr:protein seele [Morus notabilis]